MHAIIRCITEDDSNCLGRVEMRRLSLLTVLEICNDLSKHLRGLGQDELGDLSCSPDYGIADSAI